MKLWQAKQLCRELKRHIQSANDRGDLPRVRYLKAARTAIKRKILICLTRPQSLTRPQGLTHPQNLTAPKSALSVNRSPLSSSMLPVQKNVGIPYQS